MTSAVAKRFFPNFIFVRAQYRQRVEKGGHDPVSRTNFNKIHASRTVLTKFHKS